MSILMSVKRTEVFSEFSPEEQKKFFDMKAMKTAHHIDTFYYSVTLNEEKVLEGNFDCPEVLRLIRDLETEKQVKRNNPEEDIRFHGLSLVFANYENYGYCLSENEMYDIFIAGYLPNYDTPRIMVQLRTRALILLGVEQAIVTSLDKLEDILLTYGLEIKEIKENRIDYAYHSNSVQSPDVFFDDENLKKHLLSNMRDGMKHFNPQTWEYNYLALGNRRSNSIFCRVYNKTKEVVEEGYKSFFFDRWREEGLISEYDKWCLEYAFIRKSYNVGIAVARIEWYLQFGKNPDIKKQLNQILENYDIKTSNVKQIYKYIDNGKGEKVKTKISQDQLCGELKEIDRLLPPVTVILNFEYQTKRYFYTTVDVDKMLNGISIVSPPHLDRLWRVLACHRSVCEYLTGVGSAMSFVRERKFDKELLEEHPEQIYQDFWWRLRGTKIEGPKIKLVRKYSQHTDIERSKRRLMRTVAGLSMMIHRDAERDRDFNEDLIDVWSTLNDNDMKDIGERLRYVMDPKTGELYELRLANKDYSKIRRRTKRMMKNRV